MANLPSYNPNDRAQYVAAPLPQPRGDRPLRARLELKPFTSPPRSRPGSSTPTADRDRARHDAGRQQDDPGQAQPRHDRPRRGAREVEQRRRGEDRAVADARADVRRRSTASASAGDARAASRASRRALRRARALAPIEQATMSYGHGLSVTPLQLARAYAVFGARRRARAAHLHARRMRRRRANACSTRTRARLRGACWSTSVSAGGTAAARRVVGYRVAGKTGTAHKPTAAATRRTSTSSSFVRLRAGERAAPRGRGR